MAKAKQSAARSSETQSSARPAAKRKNGNVGGDLHGRAGESLPARERATVGNEPDWERAETSAPPEAETRGRRRQGNPVVEIEYERGPGSHFQVEGRGRPRSKRQNKTKGKA